MAGIWGNPWGFGSNWSYPTMPNTGPYSGGAYLNSEPQAAWSAAVLAPAQSGAPGGFYRWLEDQAGNYYNQYQALLGSGQIPLQSGGGEMGFYDWAKTINPYQQFQSYSPYQRGEQVGKFQSPMKWAI